MTRRTQIVVLSILAVCAASFLLFEIWRVRPALINNAPSHAPTIVSQ